MKPASLLAKTRSATAPGRTGWGMIVGLGLVSVVFGCDVSLIAEVVQAPTRNTCDTESDCGQGGICLSSRCQTDTTDIEALVLEITPTISAASNQSPSLAGVTFTSFIEEFEQGSAGYEITLPHLSVIESAVRIPSLSEGDCLADPLSDPVSGPVVAMDRSVPARVTLTPRQRLLGLTNPIFTSQTDSLVALGDGTTGYRVGLTAPPGQYDIYVEPAESIQGCLYPPLLFVDQEFSAGDVTLELDMPVPQILGVSVRYPRASDDLKDWTLDVIQKDSGRRLSTRAVLGDPVERDGVLEYEAQVVFSSGATSPAEVASEIVRLSPPELAVAPTIYIERSLIDLFQDGTGLIDQLTELADSVAYSSRLTMAGLSEPAPATVTFIATELETSEPGVVAGFSRTVETDAEGFFDVDLLPGTYTVLTEPVDPGFERKITRVIVSDASSSQTGLTIELLPRFLVSGRVVSFQTSVSVFGAAIAANAVPDDPRPSVIQSAQGALQILPASVGDTSKEDGTFTLRADSGTFHLSARPDPSTGFSWGVRLSVDVIESESVGDLELPLPVIVEGRLSSRDLNGIVPGALIRAFALLDDGALAASLEEADSVISVAEARVDDGGNFVLLLPSTLK